MIVGILTAELFIYEAQSLKEKRSVVKSLLERIRHRYGISCAEVGAQDLWQRTVLGFAVVSGDRRHAEEVLTKVESELTRESRTELLGTEKEYV